MALTREQRKIILLSSLGGALEFYDFIIFSIFAPIIGEIFFPKHDPLVTLINVYAVFAIGYLIRPLGGMIFSHFGDKYGRKKTFVSSIMLMAVPTFMIGLLPTYETVGLSAAIALVALRIIQGFSIGGEIPGALTYTCEHVADNSRCFTSGVIFAFFNFGIVIGACISLLLSTFLSHASLLVWGWRIPFLLGGVLGLISFYLRKQMTESPLFASFHQAHAKLPLFEILRNHWRQVLQGLTLTWLSAVVINLLFLYLPTYLTTILSYPKQQVDLLNTLNLILEALLIITVSYVADRTNKRIFLIIGAIGFVLSSYFIFAELNVVSIEKLMIIMVMISLMSSCINVYPAVLVELFPTAVRYTGIALSYNIGFAIFGGLTPLISTYLIHLTANTLSPSYYLVISAVCFLIAALSLKPKTKVLAIV